MNTPLPEGISPQELARLHDAAADWFVRRQQAQWSGADERALDDWLGRSPLHRAIFDGMSRSWHSAPQLRQLFPEEFGQALASPVVSPGPPAGAPAAAMRPAAAPGPAWRWGGRPVRAVLGLVLMLAVGAGWYRWDNTPSFSLQAGTAAGQTRVIALPDGSQISLNVASQVQVRYYPRRREVVLDHGEAFFQVAASPRRPFTVDSGASQVKVVGTAFNVRSGPPRLEVKVLQGRVELRGDRHRADGDVVLLVAGTGMAVDGATGQRSPLPADPDTVGDWRTGQLRFSATPLAEVARELSRYLDAPVTLQDPALGQLRVSGLLATAAPERFLRALPASVAVRVQRQGDGWVIRRD